MHACMVRLTEICVHVAHRQAVVAMQAAPTSADDRESERESARALHNAGATRVSAALGDRVREWALVAFVDRMHALWADEISNRLESMRPRWFDGVGDGSSSRPGEVVAAEVSRQLRPHGIIVTATHPSAQQTSPWELTGPRFYASLVEAARGPEGCCTDGHAPRPPAELIALLWSTREDASRPWVSELGWTHVPPASHPQLVHADIVNDGCWRDGRAWGHSRYTHLVWKADGSGCTTEIVPGAFTNGSCEEGHFDRLTMLGGRCLVLDSEVLHRGGNTFEQTGWTSSCTVQLCATSAMPALRRMTDPALLPYMLPIEPSEVGTPPPPLRDVDGANEPSDGRALSDAVTGSPHKRLRVGPDLVGAEAWQSEERADAAFASVVAADVHRRLNRDGWYELELGLPQAWAEWPVVAFVESCHAKWAELVEKELTEALKNEQRNGARARPGEAAAQAVSRRLATLGVAVYVPPPCVSDDPPYGISGPRFYVSVTAAAAAAFGGYECVPSLPHSLRDAIWPHGEDQRGVGRIRGLGWALAPCGSDPQELHADLWGHTPKLDRVRFPHLIWKRDRTQCTTEVVRGGFTRGVVATHHYASLVTASAPAILVDAEALHRGGRTPPHAAPMTPGDESSKGWVSSCSVEMCSSAGWRAWLEGTGGTEADPNDPEYRMLSILQPLGS